MVELDHPIATEKPLEDQWKLVLDLERLVGCVQGGSVTEKVSSEEVKAEIRVKMGSMSLRFRGTVLLVEHDEAVHTALLRVKSREVGGSGQANADVTFALAENGGTVHTAAQISGKAASMGQGTVATVLDALITDFTNNFVAAT